MNLEGRSNVFSGTFNTRKKHRTEPIGMITGRSVRQDHIQNQRIHDASIPRDPAVPAERKWDWGIIYYIVWRVKYLLRQCLDP